jgi:hypothetical protein
MMLTMIGFAVASARLTGAYWSNAAISTTCTRIVTAIPAYRALASRGARAAGGRSETGEESAG